jgi:hypothetical protein
MGVPVSPDEGRPAVSSTATVPDLVIVSASFAGGSDLHLAVSSDGSSGPFLLDPEIRVTLRIVDLRVFGTPIATGYRARVATPKAGTIEFAVPRDAGHQTGRRGGGSTLGREP